VRQTLTNVHPVLAFMATASTESVVTRVTVRSGSQVSLCHRS